MYTTFGFLSFVFYGLRCTYLYTKANLTGEANADIAITYQNQMVSLIGDDIEKLTKKSNEDKSDLFLLTTTLSDAKKKYKKQRVDGDSQKLLIAYANSVYMAHLIYFSKYSFSALSSNLLEALVKTKKQMQDYQFTLD